MKNDPHRPIQYGGIDGPNKPKAFDAMVGTRMPRASCRRIGDAPNLGHTSLAGASKQPRLIHLALFLLPYAPRRLRPWLMGIAIGRKPEQMEWRDGKWRFPDAP